LCSPFAADPPSRWLAPEPLDRPLVATPGGAFLLLVGQETAGKGTLIFVGLRCRHWHRHERQDEEQTRFDAHDGSSLWTIP